MEQPPDRKNRPWRFSTFVYSSSILFLLLSILILSFTTTDLYKTQSLRLTFTAHRIYTYLQPLFSKSETHKPLSSPSHCVLWMAPFLSSGGYSSEAWSYVLSLRRNLENPKFRIAIEHHGDLQSIEFWNGLARETKELAIEMHNTVCRPNETIVVCHSEPGAWYPPLFETLPCPPYGYGDFRGVIGRTMFETDRVNRQHVERCNKMDRVWVPTEFHVSSFVESGVDSSKVVKIVQPVDVDVFDPLKYEPLDLVEIGDLVLGGSGVRGLGLGFVFLSVFKWEQRKGWDVLLKAYLSEFSGKDSVALFLLTNAYHSDGDFENKIVDFVKELNLEEGEGGYASVYVIDKHIAQVDLPRLYKAADAFVLPTRGEGWGRPIVEAMAMSLPVIATNWSGPTEYLTEENGYLLVVEEMSEVKGGPFEGHLWAEPSVDKLRVLMRRVVSEPDEAKVKGKRGREDMVKNFAPEVVAKVVADQIERIFKEKIRR
ncbi:Mannosyltransferase [Hirschfeldia incana]|nr:Mannosyltransferase [Hirschfeldia incana]